MPRPNRVRIGSHMYRPMVLHVKSTDAKGRPKEATILYDEEKVHLEGGEVFLVVFAQEQSLAPKD